MTWQCPTCDDPKVDFCEAYSLEEAQLQGEADANKVVAAWAMSTQRWLRNEAEHRDQKVADLRASFAGFEWRPLLFADWEPQP